jgi:hypothetical protein
LIMPAKAKTMISGANITTQPEDVGLHGHRVAEDRQQRRCRADGPGNTARQQHADRHQPVDLVHVGAQALINLGRPDASGAGADGFILCHSKPPFRSQNGDPGRDRPLQ